MDELASCLVVELQSCRVAECSSAACRSGGVVGSTLQLCNSTTLQLAPAHDLHAPQPVVSAIRGRVLVVDDEPAIRALVAKVVERAGYPVDVAGDGREAREMVDRRDYAVVVLDLMMPHINGFEFVELLRDRPAPRPAVIVITAALELPLTRQLDPHIVHSIVRKPFDINALGDLIAAAAESVAQAREGEGDNVVEFPR